MKLFKFVCNYNREGFDRKGPGGRTENLDQRFGASVSKGWFKIFTRLGTNGDRREVLGLHTCPDPYQ